jgi:putative transposase
MVRLARLNPPGITQHIIQRGNTRQICFSGEADFSRYLAWLAEYSKRFGMDIHAYVLMTNHVHILATPQGADLRNPLIQALQNSGLQSYSRLELRLRLIRASRQFLGVQHQWIIPSVDIAGHLDADFVTSTGFMHPAARLHHGETHTNWYRGDPQFSRVAV